MIKKNLIKLIILLVFVSGCGYSPIFSNKNSNFSIQELNTIGNVKLNKIINNKLNNYSNIDSQKKFSLKIETFLKKEITSKDSKGNPKTYRINLKFNVLIIDSNGNEKKKVFSKSIDYNNRDNKSELKKYENETAKNLAEKISNQIIIYLSSI